MKALLIILSTVLSANLAFASGSCFKLFQAGAAIQNDLSSFSKRLNDLKVVRDKVESLNIQKIKPAAIVKIPMVELKSEIESQILLLEKAKTDVEFKNDFLKEMIEIHQSHLKNSLKKSINLEQHFRLSLKTLLLVDQKLDHTPKDPYFPLTTLQKKRLADFLNDKTTDALFLKSFPNMREFITEWQKSLKASSSAPHRILIFSTLDMRIPDFNNFLSPDISFLGLVDYVSHPDGTPVAESPRGFASHDLSHHQLYRSQHKTWVNSGFTIAERRQLMLEIRKNYLIAREKLDPKSRMSLDILYFEFFHEDTNIFANFMKYSPNGNRNDVYNLEKARILTFNEIHHFGMSARATFPAEFKESNLVMSEKDPYGPLHKSMKPSWDLMTEIWSKSYKSLEKQ